MPVRRKRERTPVQVQRRVAGRQAGRSKRGGHASRQQHERASRQQGKSCAAVCRSPWTAAGAAGKAPLPLQVHSRGTNPSPRGAVTVIGRPTTRTARVANATPPPKEQHCCAPTAARRAAPRAHLTPLRRARVTNTPPPHADALRGALTRLRERAREKTRARASVCDSTFRKAPHAARCSPRDGAGHCCAGPKPTPLPHMRQAPRRTAPPRTHQRRRRCHHRHLPRAHGARPARAARGAPPLGILTLARPAPAQWHAARVEACEGAPPRPRSG